MNEAYWSWLVTSSSEEPLVSVSVLPQDNSAASKFSSLICETAETKNTFRMPPKVQHTGPLINLLITRKLTVDYFHDG